MILFLKGFALDSDSGMFQLVFSFSLTNNVFVTRDWLSQVPGRVLTNLTALSLKYYP